MSVDSLTFVAQMVNFTILIWILNNVLYGPILEAIQKREDRFLQRESELEELDKTCLALKEELEAEKKAFLDSSEQRRREALAEARTTKDKELAKARKEVESLKRRWTQGLEEQRQEFLVRLRRKTAGSALKIAGRVIHDLTGEDDLQQLTVSRFLESCEDLHLEGAVVVRSASVLEKKQQKRLRQRFPDAVFEVDPELVLGLELVHDGHRIGWSARAHLQVMEEEVAGLVDGEAIPT